MARRNVPVWGIRADGSTAEVTVAVPVLAGIASDSGKVIARAANAGQLGAMAREISQIEKAEAASAEDLPGKIRYWEKLAAATPDPDRAADYRQRAADAREQLATDADHTNKAADYEAKARRVTDPELAKSYRDLAAAERSKAGTL